MKLAELGLKTKPATKYFEGGYVKFSTQAGHLFFTINSVTKTNQGSLIGGIVKSQEQLKQLLSAKHITQVLEV